MVLSLARLRTHLNNLTNVTVPKAAAQPDVHCAGTWVPPGHFYSPIVSPDELRALKGSVFDRSGQPSAIDLNEHEQLKFAKRIAELSPLLSFPSTQHAEHRYFYENSNFSYGDAIVLSAFLMHYKPRRVVEIGSGYSSCVILDINDAFLDSKTKVTFVEPYPDLLRSLMKPADEKMYQIIGSSVQQLDLAIIDELQEDDILFIDSTHVSKAGSDVNFELFTILPQLKSGVLIHIHDMFYPFEYPEAWFFEENRSWNELYAVQAFLMYNTAFKIMFFNHFMALQYPAVMEACSPLLMKNSGGSLWLRKS